MEAMTGLRSLPSVDHLLQSEEVKGWIGQYGRDLTLEAIRASLDEIRRRYPKSGKIPTTTDLLAHIGSILTTWTSASLTPVINATGVILHTNLGRAPLSQAAIKAIHEIALGYSNLEYDLEKGARGSRLVHAEELLRRITGTEAALVVNNNASAVLLALSALGRRRGVVIARSQLVEIGGGFRIPDVMKQSGARLIEVGTTNRVHRSDYEEVLAEQRPALIMRAHRSNFRITGFTSEPSLGELAEIAHQAGILLVDDLGSGTFLDTSCYGLQHEPTVQESLQTGSGLGADLVCFSGDKLLGGPQAGILIGRGDLIARLRKHPLARAIRADKLCLAGLTATLLHYLKGEAEREIPIWRMISADPEALQVRASSWAAALGRGEVISGLSTVGGGSLPGETLPTFLLALAADSPNRFLASLRRLQPPIIARLDDERVVLDPRTVLPEEDETLLQGLAQHLS
jgi:L-seryl-tRNA(Ser) seleniumtransferase